MTMANSALALDQGRQLADKLSQVIAADNRLSANDDSFILAAFEQVLCRLPTSREQQACSDFLAKQRALYQRTGADQLQSEPPKGVAPAAADPLQRSRESLVRTLLNHNDFVTVH